MRTIRRTRKLLARVLFAGLAALALVAAGCRSPLTVPVRPVPAAAVANAVPVASPNYPVVFPDVVELDVAGKPECSGRRLVYPDGRIDLGPHGAVFAEGCTAAEISRRVAAAAGISDQSVHCRVAQARSRFVYVVGPGGDRPQAVPYTGPEHVVETLHRAGGFSPDAPLADVRVVRRNVARGTPAETFHVDLAAVRKGDGRTNIVLEPNDEVHIRDDHGITLTAFRSDRLRP